MTEAPWIYAILMVFLSTWLLSARAMPIATYLGILDTPGGRKNHSDPTPLMGGVTISLVLVPSFIWWAAFGSEATGSMLGLTASGILIFAILGTVDDRHNLGATERILLSVAVFSILVFLEPLFRVHIFRFTGVSQAILLGPLTIPFTVFALFGLLNAVNMADGKNGLALGMSIGWTAILSAYAPAELIPPLLFLMAMLVVLFFYNIFGRLFLGDGGSYGLTALIGLLAIYIYNTSKHPIYADTLATLFCVPVLDMVRLTLARAARGQSPFDGDRDHLHHHMLASFGWPKGLIFYLLLAIGPSAAILFRPGTSWLMLVLTVFTYFMTIAVLGNANKAK